MKIGVISDIHIHDWTAFSKFDDTGRPDRLIKYIDLAHIFSETCLKENCDLIILPGDISECAVQKPRVLDVIGDFLRIVSKNTPTLIIPGQHDMDTKEAQNLEYNCVLTEICKDLPNITLFNEPEVHLINGVSFLMNPWNSEHSIIDAEADVFIGHGIVRNSQDEHGYIFENGFDSDKLAARFDLSIIGDLHRPQILSETVLVPGTPLQNTYKDSIKNGFWTINYEKKKLPEFKYCDIHELRPNFFHRFYTTEDKTAVSTDLVHFRMKPFKIKDQKQAVTISDNSVNREIILKEGYDILSNAAPEIKDKCKDLFKSCVEMIKDSKTKIIAQSLVKDITVKNFLSIADMEFDFSAINRKCVIVGKNGTGKTSLAEAVYWCLTGQTTKKVSSDSVVSFFAKEEETSVRLKIEVNGDDLEITRSRVKGKPYLTVTIKGIESNRSSVRETQEMIYDMLGITQEEIYLLSYFSAQQAVLFGDQTDTFKYNTLSSIAGLTHLDPMREFCLKKAKEVQDRLSIKRNELSSIKNEWDVLKRDFDTAVQKVIPKIEAPGQTEIDLEIKQLESLIAVKRPEKEKLIPNLDALKKKSYSFSSRLNSLSEQNKKNTAAIEKSSGMTTCPTCFSEVSPEKIIEHLKAENIGLEQEYKILKEGHSNIVKAITEKEEQLRFIEAEISSAERKKFQLIDKFNSLSNKADQKVEDQNKLQTYIIEKIGIKKNQYFETEKLIEELDNEYLVVQAVGKVLKKDSELVERLIQYGIQILQNEINSITKDSTFKLKINSDVTLTADFKGRILEYFSLSSGQRRVFDIVLMVALNNLFSKYHHLQYGILGLSVFDEILSFLDLEYVEEVSSVLDQIITEKTLVITHDDRLAASFDQRINVTVSNGKSNYTKNFG